MSSNALERVARARNLPQQIEALERQLQQAGLKIARLEKELERMGKALKKHLQHHQQLPSLLDRLLGR